MVPSYNSNHYPVLSFPEDASILSLLKTCTKQKNLQEGSRIHGDLLSKGWLHKDIRIGNSLVGLYAKCGAILKAQEVFDELPCKDVISWNALITGYSQQGKCGDITMKWFEEMKQQGFSPNVVTFISALKACSCSCSSINTNIEICEKGKELHACFASMGLLQENVLVGTTLVDMYAKWGDLSRAQGVFNMLRERNVVTWTSLISGYAQHGCGEEAISCYEEMQQEGISPNPVTFLCILKACAKTGAILKGEEIHAQIVRKGFLLGTEHTPVRNALVDMYAKYGAFEKAEEVFRQSPVWNVVSWTALISGYTQHGRGHEALECFEMMERNGFWPNVVTYLCILKACGLAGAIGKGEKIHAEIVRERLLEKNVSLGNALIDMYAKFGLMAKAEGVFESLQTVRNEVSWNTLIGGYSQNGFCEEALHYFEQMQRGGFSPNIVTFLYILKACGRIQAVDKAREIHDQIMRTGLLGKEVSIGTALVGMYAECGDLVKAQEVFDELPIKDVVSWTTLISGYTQQGDGEKALNCFKEMQKMSVSANPIAYLSILKACGSIGAIDMSKEIHAQIAKEGLIQKDITIGNALVDMYAKCGVLVKAQEVFDELPMPDVVSWNVLMAGFHMHGEEALNLFKQMQHKSLSPDAFTFVIVLKACGSIGALHQGLELHAIIASSGINHKYTLYGNDTSEQKDTLLIGNALIGMYTNCGALSKAQQIFDRLETPDVVSWTALIAAYSLVGKDEKVVDLFEKMIGEGIESDLVTFTVVLNACSHLALLDKAQMYFESMSTRCGFMPTQEHHSCMVDLFGRAGHFDKVVTMIVRMPMQDYLPMWTALLGACQKWGNVYVGRLAFDHAIQCDRKHVGTYICMRNIYAAAMMQEEAEKIEAMRVKLEGPLEVEEL